MASGCTRSETFNSPLWWLRACGSPWGPPGSPWPTQTGCTSWPSPGWPPPAPPAWTGSAAWSLRRWDQINNTKRSGRTKVCSLTRCGWWDRTLIWDGIVVLSACSAIFYSAIGAASVNMRLTCQRSTHLIDKPTRLISQLTSMETFDQIVAPCGIL